MDLVTVTVLHTHVQRQQCSRTILLLGEPAQQVVCSLLQEDVVVSLIGQIRVIVVSQCTQTVH